MTFYLFIMQLLIILVLLFAWPYLLAAGIILRSTFLTRRLGGLLIAIVVASLLVFPLMFLLEYSALSNPSIASPIGANTLPNLPLYEYVDEGGGIANVIVYGASSGYVPAIPTPPGSPGWVSSCSGYVFENRCGKPSTIPAQNTQGWGCVSSVTEWQKCHDGYMQSAPQCPGAFVYESVCGDSNTMQRNSGGIDCVGSMPSGASACAADSVPMGAGISAFVLPNASRVLRYYGCMPSNLLGYEAGFSAWYLIPFYGAGLGVASAIGGLASNLPYVPPSMGCTPDNAINAALALPNIYGITAIMSFILPLLNILITLSAISHISGLMGGDTTIVGLSKLI